MNAGPDRPTVPLPEARATLEHFEGRIDTLDAAQGFGIGSRSISPGNAVPQNDADLRRPERV